MELAKLEKTCKKRPPFIFVKLMHNATEHTPCSCHEKRKITWQTHTTKVILPHIEATMGASLKWAGPRNLEGFFVALFSQILPCLNIAGVFHNTRTSSCSFHTDICMFASMSPGISVNTRRNITRTRAWKLKAVHLGELTTEMALKWLLVYLGKLQNLVKAKVTTLLWWKM